MSETNPVRSSPFSVHLFAAVSLVFLLSLALFASSLNVAVFFDLISLIIVVGCTFFALFVSHLPMEIVRAFRCALLGQSDPSGEALRILTLARTYALSFGSFGFLTGVIGMLASLDDPWQIGRGLAISLVSVLYAVVLSEVVLQPLASRLSRGPAPAARAANISRTGVYILATVGGTALAFLGLALGLMIVQSENESPRNLRRTLRNFAPDESPATWVERGDRRVEVVSREGARELVGRGEFFDPSGVVLPDAEAVLVVLGAKLEDSDNELTIRVESGPEEAAGLARAQALRAFLQEKGGVDRRRFRIRSTPEPVPDPAAAFTIEVGDQIEAPPEPREPE